VELEGLSVGGCEAPSRSLRMKLEVHRCKTL
jgi:hypothetical protein